MEQPTDLCNQNGARNIDFKKRRRSDALSWLSEIPYLETHTRIHTAIIPGTSMWLFSKPEFLAWEGGSDSALFCLGGPPGCGKTAISSNLVGEIQRRAGGNPNITLNYFYCSSSSRPEHSAKSVILTFIHQILTNLPLGRNVIEDQYNAWCLKDFNNDSISLEEAYNLYQEATAQFQRVYIVIDGLNELESYERPEILNALHDVLADSEVCFKIFISLSDEEKIYWPLDNWRLKIQSSDTGDDLRQLFDANMSRIEGNTSLEVGFKAVLKRALYNKVSRNMHGTFLWIRLLFNDLNYATTEAGAFCLIEEFPVRLQDIYSALWYRINTQADGERFIARTVIEFLTHSQEAVSARLIEGLVSRQAQSRREYQFSTNPDDILRVCRGMVAYDGGSQSLHLTHSSARQYLLELFDPQIAHARIAEACLREPLAWAHFLQFAGNLYLPSNQGLTDGRPAIWFKSYAAKHWHYHSRNCIRTSAYKDAEWEFMQHSLAARTWVLILERAATTALRQRWRTFFAFVHAFPDSRDLCFLTSCFFGVEGMYRALCVSTDLTAGMDTIMPSFDHIRECIPWSRSFTYMPNLRALATSCLGLTREQAKEQSGLDWPSTYAEELYQVAEIMSDVRYAGIICSAEQGHEDIFNMIWDELDCSISDPLLSSIGDCCCLLATAGEHIGILDYLNFMGHRLGAWHPTLPFSFVSENLIRLSAYLGSRDMLLYWKEKLEKTGLPRISRLLSGAVLRADDKAVALLLEEFENNISEDGIGISLVRASELGYDRIINHLLRHPEKDVNYQRCFGETALMAVADSGPAVAALCEDEDLDVDMLNHLGETALDIFIKSCCPSALAELLKHPNIDINRRGRWGETPLITAVRLKHVDVAKVLLQLPCIDLKARDDDGLTASEIARRLDLAPLLRLFVPTTGVEEGDLTLGETEDLSLAMTRSLTAGTPGQLFSGSYREHLITKGLFT